MKKLKDHFLQAHSPYLINMLVPSVKKINIGNLGIQVNNWGGAPINFAGDLDFQYWFFFVPGNQQINAKMVNCRLFID